jgi:hypothetical protein
MERARPVHVYRMVVIALAVIALLTLIVIGVALIAGRPPSPEAVAATLTAMPTSTMTTTPEPTPVPTVPGISEDLLVCQREAGRAMNARGMVGAVNISDDHLLLMSWVSTDWAVHSLDDALSGVILAFDVALDLWQRGCAVYDRVQVDVYDGPKEDRTHRLTVNVPMDDLLRWRAGEFSDSELVARLRVTQPSQ